MQYMIQSMLDSYSIVSTTRQYTVLDKFKKFIKVDDFDTATIGSVVLGIADIIWLSHDITKNGTADVYNIIGFMFLLGNILLVIGFRQHHIQLAAAKARRLDRKECKDELADEHLEHLQSEAVRYILDIEEVNHILDVVQLLTDEVQANDNLHK